MTQATPSRPHTAALEAALRLWTALEDDPICDLKAKERICAAQNISPQLNSCPLCEHVMRTHGYLNCTQCPVDEWADESTEEDRYGCTRILFGEWEDLSGEREDFSDLFSQEAERRDLAAQIRDLIASNLPQE